MLQTNHVTVRSPKITRSLTFAICTDFHNGRFDRLRPSLSGVDGILIVGDLVDRHDRRGNGYDQALRFLSEAPRIAPTFYSLGNHERMLPRLAEYWPQAERCDVTVLDDRFVTFGGIVLGGLSSIRMGAHGLPLQLAEKNPFLRAMSEQAGFKLLMCHHPEYYADAVKNRNIDLTIAGHAHGGQVRIGRQGLFAPGQGYFPRLTSGFYDGDRLLVSRGITNATWAPRINCPCEVIILHLEGLGHAQCR